MTLALAVISICAVLVLGDLRVNDDHELLLRSSNAQYKKYLRFKDSYPQEQQDIIVVLEGDLLSNAALNSLYSATESLYTLNDVTNVSSLISIPWVDRTASASLNGDQQALSQIRDKLSLDQYLPGNLVSPGFDTTVLTVTLRKQAIENNNSLGTAVETIRDTLAQSLAPQFKWHLAGYPTLRHSLIGQINQDSLKFGGLAFLFATLAACIIFRNVAQVLTALIAPALAVAWTLGLMSLFKISINSLNQMVVVLILVITYTDSVHATMHLRDQITSLRSATQAMRSCIEEIMPACLLTSITTAIGFGSLCLSDSALIKQFGLVCAIGTLIGFMAVLFCIPLSTMLMRYSTRDQTAALANYHWRLPVKTDYLVLLFSVLITAWLVFTAGKLRPGYYLGENLPHDSEFNQALAISDKQLGGVLPLHILVQWDEDDPRRFKRRLNDIRKVQRKLTEETNMVWVSVSDMLRFSPGFNSTSKYEMLPDQLAAKVFDDKNSNALISTHLPLAGSAALNDTIYDLDEVLEKINGEVPGVELEISGSLPLINATSQQMIMDLVKGLGSTFAVISLLLVLVLKSWRLGLLLIIPNIAPVAVVAALLVLAGKPLQYASVIVFSICLGIAIDDSIHFINRYLRYRKSGLSLHDSVARTQRSVGRILIMTTTILIAGLLALLFSVNPTVSLIGALLIAALLTALVFDLVLLPVLLRLFVITS